MDNRPDDNYLIANCRSGCTVGWSSPVVPIADTNKFISAARSLGYRLRTLEIGEELPMRVNLQCEHR